MIIVSIYAIFFMIVYLWNMEKHFVLQYYNSKRYIKLLKSFIRLKEYKKYLLMIILWLLSIFFMKRLVYLSAFIFLLSTVVIIYNFPKEKCAFTRRNVTLLLTATIPFLCFFYLSYGYLFIAITVGLFIMPFYIMGINYLLIPVEIMIKRKYIKRAQNKLLAMKKLKIVAITGSYGKTSLKNILWQLLSLKYHVQMSPKSVNTLMGLTKFINEQVLLSTEILILECGVDEKGGMDKILSLFTPDVAILSAIGAMHLSTFNNIYTIYDEKKKLLKKAKCGFYNFDNPFLREHQNELSTYHAYSIGDYFKTYQRGENGLEVILNNDEVLSIPLYGFFQLQNISGAIAVAEFFNVERQEWLFLLPTLKGVDHRLVKKYYHDMIIFDDAYNGNEEGIIEAIKTVMIYHQKKGLITPGVIELGTEYEKVNRHIASYLDNFDFICIVAPNGYHPIYDEYVKQYGNHHKITYVKSFKEGFAKMLEYKIKVLLIANDTFNTFLK